MSDVSPSLLQDRNGPQPCPRQESNLQNQQPEKTMTKLRCSRALWGRGAHREGGTSASTNVEKTYESHSGIGAPSGTPHRAPRPPPLPREKQERGDSPAHEPGIEPGTVPTKTFGDTRAKQKRSTPLFTKQNMLSRKKPHVLGHYSFLDMYTVWGNNSPPGTYTVWGKN